MGSKKSQKTSPNDVVEVQRAQTDTLLGILSEEISFQINCP